MSKKFMQKQREDVLTLTCAQHDKLGFSCLVFFQNGRLVLRPAFIFKQKGTGFSASPFSLRKMGE